MKKYTISLLLLIISIFYSFSQEKELLNAIEANDLDKVRILTKEIQKRNKKSLHKIKNLQGNTPLHIAVDLKYYDILAYFLKLNVDFSDINIQNKQGNTALHIATYKNDLKAVEILLNTKNININKVNHHGETPRYLAKTHSDIDIVKVLDAQKAKLTEPPLFVNDAIVLGILLLLLAVVFHTSEMPALKKFYKFVPALLLCYFLPSLLSTANVFSPEVSGLKSVAKNYFLPASLALFCISIDFKGLASLGGKAIIMFFAASLGIILGGPIAVLCISAISPSTVEAIGGGDALWSGLSTVAGSWMGGGANQTAMKETFNVGSDLFSAMVTIDIITANIWMAFLLYGAGISQKLDKWLKADSSSIKAVQDRIENYQKSIEKNPSFTDITTIVAVGLSCTALAHLGGEIIAPFIKTNVPALADLGLGSSFLWVVLLATTFGVILSFTSIRKLEGAGASKFGSLFLYFLIATIGMEMNVLKIFETPMLFLIGIVWMSVHILVLLLVAKIVKAPFFFVAVGSQANVGGAASAPVVASAFRPSLAIVGVLLAVLGYAVGTYGALLTAWLMQSVL